MIRRVVMGTLEDRDHPHHRAVSARIGPLRGSRSVPGHGLAPGSPAPAPD